MEIKLIKNIWQDPPAKNRKYIKKKDEIQTNYAGGKRGQP
jgi:hypothetical protein